MWFLPQLLTPRRKWGKPSYIEGLPLARHVDILVLSSKPLSGEATRSSPDTPPSSASADLPETSLMHLSRPPVGTWAPQWTSYSKVTEMPKRSPLLKTCPIQPHTGPQYRGPRLRSSGISIDPILASSPQFWVFQNWEPRKVFWAELAILVSGNSKLQKFSNSFPWTSTAFWVYSCCSILIGTISSCLHSIPLRVELMKDRKDILLISVFQDLRPFLTYYQNPEHICWINR